MNPETFRKLIFPQGGRYLWGALAGDSHAAKRQAIMAAAGHKLPRSKCGLTAVMDTLLKLAGSDQNQTPNARENDLNAWLHSVQADRDPVPDADRLSAMAEDAFDARMEQLREAAKDPNRFD